MHSIYHDQNTAINRCPCRPAHVSHRFSDKQVEDAMYRLMPGWFTMLDDLMDPYGPDPHISHIQAVADKNPNEPLDDIIHEEFHETWFQYHADGDDDW